MKIDKVKKEAEIMSKLYHPFIVQYYDEFENKEYFHIVMEYCEVNVCEQIIAYFKINEVFKFRMGI